MSRSRSPRRFDSGDSGELAVEVEVFCGENEVDESAAEQLRAEPEDVIRAVINEGPISGRNKSAILIGRLRRVKNPGDRRGGGRGGGPYGSQPPPPSHPPPMMMMGGGHIREHGFLMQEAETFAQEYQLDASAREHLLSQPDHVLQATLDEGPLTGRNPSAVLFGRVRRILANPSRLAAPGGYMPGPVMMPMGMQMPHFAHFQPPPPHHPPPSTYHPRKRSRSRSTSPMRRFVAENGLDEKARQKLREQTKFVQYCVVHEGALTGRNLAAVLGGRIRRIIENEAHEKEKAILDFADDNKLDESAIENLRGISTDLLAIVLEEGPLTGRNPSAIVISRIRRARDTLRDGGGRNGHGGRMGDGQPPPPTSAPPGGGVHPQVVAWAVENRLDDSARDKLFDQPWYMQERVLAEGPLTGRNPSAVLLSRLRRLESGGGYQGGQPPPPSQPPPPIGAPPCYLAPMGMPMAMDPYQQRRAATPVSEFARANGLDERAEQLLAEKPFAVQKAVIEEGPLTGRNPSAVMMSRIKRIYERLSGEDLAGEGGGAGGPQDELMRFVARNGLDESAVKALRDAPEEVREEVIAEGEITGRNPSAVLLSRLRRMGAGGGAGRG